MLMPSHHLARAEKVGIMLTLVRVPSDATPCELVVKLHGRTRLRARLRSIEDGQAVFYALAVLLDNLSFDTPAGTAMSHIEASLSDSPFQPTLTYED